VGVQVPSPAQTKKGSEKSEPFFNVLAGSVIETDGLFPEAFGCLRDLKWRRIGSPERC
jgi:hypothetical protein